MLSAPAVYIDDRQGVMFSHHTHGLHDRPAHPVGMFLNHNRTVHRLAKSLMLAILKTPTTCISRGLELFAVGHAPHVSGIGLDNRPAVNQKADTGMEDTPISPADKFRSHFPGLGKLPDQCVGKTAFGLAKCAKPTRITIISSYKYRTRTMRPAKVTV